MLSAIAILGSILIKRTLTFTEHEFMKEYDFSYLSEHLPEPDKECRMCFIEICEHAAVWVETEQHSRDTCHSINNQLAILLLQLKSCDERPYRQILCDHVKHGGISTSCHPDIECFEKELYDSILDCIAPNTGYHQFDQLFPRCLEHHGSESSAKYRRREIHAKHRDTVVREWNKMFYF